jgi:hypothetical protein
MCQATSAVQSPSVGALVNTQGQAASQLQVSKYFPLIFHCVTVSSFGPGAGRRNLRGWPDEAAVWTRAVGNTLTTA